MRSNRLPLALAIVLTLGPGAAAIADEPDQPERFTYRVLGLFAPNREQALREVFQDLPDLSLVAVDFDDAEIVVEFVPGTAFPGTKPDQLVERFDQKLRSASRGAFSVKPRRTVPRDELQQVVIPIAGLDCQGCCLAAYEAVARIDGVVQATASFKEGRLTAWIDPSKTDRATLADTLRKRGVDVVEP